MKKWIKVLLIILVIVAILIGAAVAYAIHMYRNMSYVAKPVIYIYPEEKTEIRVELDYNGALTSTYPKYSNVWDVVAEPDGTLMLPDSDREYYCLFWEGIPNFDFDMSKGFVIAGKDTEAFLESSLKTLGLTDKEANEFIIYWLPQMEENAYNLISFQNDVYKDNAKLNVEPAPDTLIRICMAWKPLDVPVEVEEQVLIPAERTGYTVVEWGGCKVD